MTQKTALKWGNETETQERAVMTSTAVPPRGQNNIFQGKQTPCSIHRSPVARSVYMVTVPSILSWPTWKNLTYSLERHEEEGQGWGRGKKKNRKCDAGSKNSAGKKDPGSDLFCIFLAENYLYQLCRHRPPFTLLRADQMWINSWLRLTSTGGRWDRPQCDACTRTVSAVLFGSLQDVEAGWGLFSAHPAGVGEGQRT